MFYVIAKDFKKQGCICHSVSDWNFVNSLMSFLNDCVNSKRIQIVCVSNPHAYGEYAPYEDIEDLGDFIKAVLSM